MMSQDYDSNYLMQGLEDEFQQYIDLATNKTSSTSLTLSEIFEIPDGKETQKDSQEI